jgi:hypothetical protein
MFRLSHPRVGRGSSHARRVIYDDLFTSEAAAGARKASEAKATESVGDTTMPRREDMRESGSSHIRVWWKVLRGEPSPEGLPALKVRR